MSKSRSLRSPIRPCSTSMRTFREMPASRARASWVRPFYSRIVRIRRPTSWRIRSHRAR